MKQLSEALSRVATEHQFSGVIRVDRSGRLEMAQPFGFAERAYKVPNTVETQFGLASGCKGFTALTVVSLVQEGRIGLGTTARSILETDLPEVDDSVTVEHLLSHRSGLGDYIDEDAGFEANDYVMRVPVHELSTTEGYLPALEGHPSKFPPGERFSYCNSGYVVLALMVERLTGTSFYELVRERVCEPAGMHDTAFLRSDELPGRAARGYLSSAGLRTNVLHLPVRGSGDGGIYSTVDDLYRFWQALFAGRIVPVPWVEEIVQPRSDAPAGSRQYGLGFWLDQGGDVAVLEGYDAGVSFHSGHARSAELTWTVVSNTSEGAGPVARHLQEALLG